MCQLLQGHSHPRPGGVVEPVREHRFVVVFRGDDLGDKVNDTDSEQTGAAAVTARGRDAASQRTRGRRVSPASAEAARVLKGQAPTNMVTRAASRANPKDRHDSRCIWVEGGGDRGVSVYKGLARLVAWTWWTPASTAAADRGGRCKSCGANTTLFFRTTKYTDSTGEDGNFRRKWRYRTAGFGVAAHPGARSPTC